MTAATGAPVDREAFAPLTWPADWPPASAWDRSFTGVPWIGPDLSFFRDLELRQAARTAATLAAWGEDAARRDLAQWFGELLAQDLGWPTPYFLPEDSFQVISYGPSYHVLDNLGPMGAVRVLESSCQVRLVDSFWEAAFTVSYGEVVDRLLARGVRRPDREE